MSQAALSEPARDWLYIAKRIPEIAWAALVGTMRNAAPSLLMAGSICGAHLMGLYSADPWWLLVPIAFGAFAVGIAQDRAEARAATEWALGERDVPECVAILLRLLVAGKITVPDIDAVRR